MGDDMFSWQYEGRRDHAKNAEGVSFSIYLNVGLDQLCEFVDLTLQPGNHLCVV